MRLKFFHVPALDPGEAESEVNQFLAAHRVASIDRHLIQRDGAAVWALCVTYLGGAPASTGGRKPKIDYKEVLSPDDFERYAALRRLRKELAEREGVPPYALFNNEQLATLVRDRVASKAELRKIPGVGPARVEKYGDPFLEKLVGFWAETTEEPDAADDDPAR